LVCNCSNEIKENKTEWTFSTYRGDEEGIHTENLKGSNLWGTLGRQQDSIEAKIKRARLLTGFI
jgi:hypothetical protein